MDEVEQIGLDAGVAERRKHRRRLVSGAALIPVDVEPDGSFGLLVDLSEQGAAVQAVAPIDSTTQKVLRWRFPGEDTATEVDGTVVWSNKNKLVGIRFDHLSDETRARIARWVGQLDENRDQPSSQAMPQAANVPALSCVLPVAPCATDTREHKWHGEELWLDMQLSILAAQVRSDLPADGVALAVASGDTFECRASAGTAPEVGVLLLGDAGLSAECIRTGQVICCVDTRTDPRVDVSVCEALQLGCAVALPVKTRARVHALLEAFWSRPKAFGESHLTALCDYAQKFGALLESHSAEVNAPDSDENSVAPLMASMPSPNPSVLKQAEPSATLSPLVRPDEPNPDSHWVPFGDTMSGMEPWYRKDTIGRLLIVATVMLLMLAAIVGVFAWFGPAGKGSPSVSAPELGRADEASSSATSSGVSTPQPENSVTTPSATKGSSSADVPARDSDLAVTDVEVVSSGQSPAHASGLHVSSPNSNNRSTTVLLDVSRDKAGKITGVRVISGDPKLAKLAKDAVASNLYPIGSAAGTTNSSDIRVLVSFGPTT